MIEDEAERVRSHEASDEGIDIFMPNIPNTREKFNELRVEDNVRQGQLLDIHRLALKWREIRDKSMTTFIRATFF